MSWWVAGVAVAGAASKFLGSQSRSKDMQEAARDSMLTARYNVNQRKLESRQTQFAMLEQGHQASSNIQRSANQAVGSATVAAGGSGAIVESGTPRAVLTNIAQEGLHAQMGAILNTKNAMKADRRQTEAMNKTEWNQASAYSKGMERDAKRTMDNARLNFAADTAAAVAGGYASSLTAASTTGKVIKGAGVVKSFGVGPTGKYMKASTGPAGRYSPAIPVTSKAGTSKAVAPKTPMQGYSMSDKQREGPSTWDKMIYQAKTRSFNPFSKSAWGQTMDFSKGRVGRGDYFGKTINFFKGTGFSGKAASKKYSYKGRRR